MSKRANISAGTRTAYRQFGERLAQLRKALGITQLELARRLGISQPKLSDYERGKVRLHAHVIAQASRALGVTSDEILGLKLTGDPRRRRRALSRKFAHRLEKIEILTQPDQNALLRTIDAYLDRVSQA